MHTSPSLPMAREATAPRAGCARCEQLPETPEGDGVLYLWFPLGHTLSKAMKALRQAGHAPEDQGNGCLGIAVDDRSRPAVFELLLGALSREEQADTRALHMPRGATPGLADIGRVHSITRYATLENSQWLLELLRESRLTSWYQPIVDSRDTTAIFAHEALLRGRAPDGAIVPPGRIFEAAEAADLVFQVDLAARLSAIRSAALPEGHTLFVNFTPAAIYDPAFCLQRTMRAVDEAGLARERVVFEVVESGQVQDPEHLRRVLDFYRCEGFRVALDDVGAGFSQLNLIHRLRPDFIKLDMGLTRDVHRDPYKAVIVQKLLEIADALSITSIAEGIECVEELAWVRDHGARYAQGYAIARPGPALALKTPALR